jgi:hypothetical protein
MGWPKGKRCPEERKKIVSRKLKGIPKPSLRKLYGKEKKCTKCHSILPIDKFDVGRISSDGYKQLRSWCTPCRMEANKERLHRDYQARAKKRERDKLYRDNNKETISIGRKKYRDKNSEILKKRKKNEYEKHKEGYLARAVNRRASMINAMPSWANQKTINLYYEIARFYSEIYDKQYSVDHIIPLKGKNVCGLHVEFNLQTIPLLDNISKGNRI